MSLNRKVILSFCLCQLLVWFIFLKQPSKVCLCEGNTSVLTLTKYKENIKLQNMMHTMIYEYAVFNYGKRKK